MPNRMRSMRAGAVVAVCASLLVGAGTASANVARDGAVAPLAAGQPLVSADQALYARAERSADWVATPSGLMHRSCVHGLPAGASVDGEDFVLAGGSHRRIPDCAYPRLTKPGRDRPADRQPADPPATHPPATGGWLIATWYYPPAGTWLRRLWADYVVPSAPQKNGALNYIFSSFEGHGNGIVQPVLTYGASPSGGGDYWYFTSWYLGGVNKVVYGSNVRVNAGDTVRGLMEANQCNADGTACHWAIRSVAKSGAESRIDITSLTYYDSAQGGVLESYGAAGCNMLPANKHIAFRNIQIFGPSFERLTPGFFVDQPDKECGMTATYTPTSTDITWTA